MTSDFDRHNPYAPPANADAVSGAPLTREQALRQLRTPATGLAVSSFVSLLWGVGSLLAGIFGDNTFLDSPLRLSLIAIILVVLPIVIIVAAFFVIRGRVQWWSWVAIITGLIPLGTGCVCLNLIFAFWLLHLMLRKDIRAALQTPDSTDAGLSPSL